MKSLRGALVGACAVVWVIAALAPVDRMTWALEQIATVLVIGAILMQRRVHYSTASLAGLALLFCAHTVGTHYTYSLTPYDAWFMTLTGSSFNDLLGWERNHYDRLVHLLWGLCLTQPICETLQQRLHASNRAAAHLSFHVVLSTSALYELMEWVAAVVFGDGSTAYVGMQGDVWDAQADIAICLLGWGFVVLLRTIRGLESPKSGRRGQGG
jgi:putative membrane protein